MSANTALRRAMNLRRDPTPHTIKTIISATKAMRNPKKLVVLPPLLGSLVPVDDDELSDEVVDGG